MKFASRRTAFRSMSLFAQLLLITQKICIVTKYFPRVTKTASS